MTGGLRRWLIAGVTLAVFWVLDAYAWALFRPLAGDAQGWTRIAALGLLRYGPWLAGPALVAALFFGPRQIAGALGLDRSPAIGFLLGFAATSVYLAGLALTAPFDPQPDWFRNSFRTAIYPAFFEEVLYRAFLFGFLFRYAGWGFLPAALASAVMFGAAHLYQGGAPLEAAGVFAITALGGLWFSWIYAEWNYNIWAPVSLHLLMNFYWDMFVDADTALGSWAVNGLRLAVIVVSVVLTLVFARRGQGRVVSGRRWFWGGA